MSSAETQSAINTLRNWSVRRVAQGKPVTEALIAARIQALWPDIIEADRAPIIAGVLAHN